MSLLLKALEKSEQDKEEQAGASPAEAQSAPESGAPAAAGKMKLAGSGGARPSKLGSALSSKKKKTGEAERVVSAYEQTGADSVEEAVVKAAAQARRRNFVLLAVVLVLAGGGYFAYQQYAPQFFPQETDTAAGAGAAAPVAEAAVAEEAVEANLLPLSEPLYDIQESISLASANVEGTDGAVAIGGGESNLSDNIKQLVDEILQAQVEVQNQQQSEVAAPIVSSQEDDPLDVLLEQEFDAASAKEVDTASIMLARLEQLEATKYDGFGADQYIKPSAISLEETRTDAAGEAQQVEPAQPAPRQAPLTIARQDSEFEQLMRRGVDQYHAGNFNAAENAFRTIIATDPRNEQALVGLAKVHQARGSIKLAVATLLKAAEYSPNNPTVIGELISLQSASADPIVAEVRLRSLLSHARSPKTQARLLFAIGNFYAKQQRWNDAKLVYFEATVLDADNPDAAYNLAVMHDFLNEKDSAVAAYRHALSKAEQVPSSFDPNVVKERISQLDTR